MKFKLAALAVFGAASIMSAAPAYSAALAMSDLTINQLGIVTSIPVSGDPTLIAAPITITSEQRTGNSTSSYNGVSGTGAGPSSLGSNTIGATVDVKYRCAGDCAAATLTAAYGATVENNLTTHLAPVPGANFALADMLISGSALSGPISGLTRANAQSAGGTNEGSANATIFNQAEVNATFAATTSFSGYIAINVDSYIRAWVDPAISATDFASASAGQGWVLDIFNSSSTNILKFNPTQLNQTAARTSNNSINNQQFIYNGWLYSGLVSFTGGQTYDLAINQSSNAIVTTRIPEPASLALVGLALLGAGMASRRSRKA